MTLLKDGPYMSETHVTYGLRKQGSLSNLLSSNGRGRVLGECGVPIARLFRLLRTLQLKMKCHVAMEQQHTVLCVLIFCHHFTMIFFSEHSTLKTELKCTKSQEIFCFRDYLPGV